MSEAARKALDAERARQWMNSGTFHTSSEAKFIYPSIPTDYYGHIDSHAWVTTMRHFKDGEWKQTPPPEDEFVTLYKEIVRATKLSKRRGGGGGGGSGSNVGTSLALGMSGDNIKTIAP